MKQEPVPVVLRWFSEVKDGKYEPTRPEDILEM